MKLLT
jgi:hypothetical protein